MTIQTKGAGVTTVQIVPEIEAEQSSASPVEMSNDALVAVVQTAFNKIKDALPYIQELLKRFIKCGRGKARIHCCLTWSEFCEKVLHRTDRAVRKALAAERNLSINRAFENLPKPTACDVCQQEFESKHDMKDHRNLAHVEEMEQRKTAWMSNQTLRKPAVDALQPSEDTTDALSLLESCFYVVRRADGKFFNAANQFASEVWTGE